MNFIQKSRLRLHVKSSIRQQTPHDDILQGGEGIDVYKFGNAADYFGKDTITDSDGKGTLQINGQTLEGTFTSYGNSGAYRLKLPDGSGAGLSVYADGSSSTGKSAILKFGSNLTNQITIKNFDETAAKSSSGNGYLGIKIDPKQAVLIKASDYATEPNPFQPWDFDPNTFAAGADSAMYEKNRKSFVVYLQQAASAGSTLILNIAGQVGQGLKAILGDSVVDANGASIELAEGQTQVSFALVSDTDISADQAGSITVNYQTSGAGSGNASSNVWGLTLKDAGEIENTLEGDFLVKTETAGSDIKRLNTQDQEIVVVRAGELYYVRDGQGNLVAGIDQPTRKPIYGEVDGQQVIVGYEEIPSNDATVITNGIFGGAGKDKILGLSGSDLLGGFGGNDEIDGGSGADMIGGGTGSDNIKGGDGDDFLSGDGIKKEGYLNSLEDALHGNDFIDGGANKRIAILTTNSIALRADSMPAKCQKSLKNRRKISQTAQNCKKSKSIRPIAGIEPVQGAIEFAVTRIESHQGAVHA